MDLINFKRSDDNILIKLWNSQCSHNYINIPMILLFVFYKKVVEVWRPFSKEISLDQINIQQVRQHL